MLTIQQEKALRILSRNNNWRRRSNILMYEPREVVDAIDVAIDVAIRMMREKRQYGIDELDFLNRNYAVESDERLTPEAQKLKQNILFIVGYLNSLRESLFSAIQKRYDAAISSESHVDEAALSLANLLFAIGEFTPDGGEDAEIMEYLHNSAGIKPPPAQQ